MPADAADIPFDDDIEFDPPDVRGDQIDPNGALISVALRAVSAAYREHALELVLADRRTPGRSPEEDVALGLLRYQLMITEFDKWEFDGMDFVPAERIPSGRGVDHKRMAWLDIACQLARELSVTMGEERALEEARAAANRAFEFLASDAVYERDPVDPAVQEAASVLSPNAKRFIRLPLFGSKKWLRRWSSDKDKLFAKDLRVAMRTRGE